MFPQTYLSKYIEVLHYPVKDGSVTLAVMDGTGKTREKTCVCA